MVAARLKRIDAVTVATGLSLMISVTVAPLRVCLFGDHLQIPGMYDFHFPVLFFLHVLEFYLFIRSYFNLFFISK